MAHGTSGGEEHAHEQPQGTLPECCGQALDRVSGPNLRPAEGRPSCRAPFLRQRRDGLDLKSNILATVTAAQIARLVSTLQMFLATFVLRSDDEFVGDDADGTGHAHRRKITWISRAPSP
jgi:hypothetical protein